jgi:hypothetical protein
MSTLLATENAFGFARHTAPNSFKETLASVHITQHEQGVQIYGKQKLPMEPKCHVYELVL